MSTPDSQMHHPPTGQRPAHTAARAVGPPPGPLPDEVPTPSTTRAGNVPAPITSIRNGKNWTFGALGMGLGLVVGLVVGALAVPFVSATTQALASSSVDLRSAVKACGLVPDEWIDVGDHGHSITMKSEGDETDGADIADVMCVLKKLDVPDSVVSEIGETRALDGRQTASWDDLAASWSYHPDDGLSIVVHVSRN